MEFLSRPEFSYVFLVIPVFFAFTVIGQGITKISKQQEDGPIALGVGIFLCMLIAAVYWFVIR